jgi:fumarate hydratase class II
MPHTRITHDTLGNVEVPTNAYWDAQTQRAVQNFNIGNHIMPIEMIKSLAEVKRAAAKANFELGKLSKVKLDLIQTVCNEIIAGKLDSEFPLSVWQTGSGTQTNMNLNEVIANRGHVINGGKLTDKTKILHPNDDVNMSQSSNDVFPTAMNISAYTYIYEIFIPKLEVLIDTFEKLSEENKDIIKTGRTHWMDATPISFGQEFSGYKHQLLDGLFALKQSLPEILQLVLGGTATGTGLNAPIGFAEKAISHIAKSTKYEFVPAVNRYSGMAAHDSLIRLHADIKRIAVSLIKIANDVRFMASGPRCGIGEISLPANEPGSSIMPGKVNPTQIEALLMVCFAVIGNDTTISMAGASGNLELNVAKPLIISKLLESAHILGDAIKSFNENCISGLTINQDQTKLYLNSSLMLITALNKEIGYEQSAKIAQDAYKNNLSLREAAIKSGIISEETFDYLVNPLNMI